MDPIRENRFRKSSSGDIKSALDAVDHSRDIHLDLSSLPVLTIEEARKQEEEFPLIVQNSNAIVRTKELCAALLSDGKSELSGGCQWGGFARGVDIEPFEITLSKTEDNGYKVHYETRNRHTEFVLSPECQIKSFNSYRLNSKDHKVAMYSLLPATNEVVNHLLSVLSTYR